MIRTPNILDFAGGEQCTYHNFQFTYKRVSYAAYSFATGLCNFPYLPFLYELLRRILREELDYAHLYAPVWSVGETYNMLRQSPICHCRFPPKAGASVSNSFTSTQLRSVLLSCSDAHVASVSQWILSWGGFRAATTSWTHEARTGRFFWQPDRATSWSGSSTSSYHTGGMATEFDRRISLMIEREKFALLTSSVSDITREQYIRCWRRWARFCACMGATPWFDSSSIGRDNVLIDFLVWEYKILDIQHGTLAKRFFAIWLIRIAEGRGDLSLRAHRVKTVIKSIKLRSKTFKKVPPNTDLLRWMR